MVDLVTWDNRFSPCYVRHNVQWGGMYYLDYAGDFAQILSLMGRLYDNAISESRTPWES